MSDRDIVDRIDELVDEQLANYDRRTGYDYNVGAERCPHCLEEWHGLPITETVRSMRSRYGYDPRVPGELDSYRADGDESAVWCPGSTFVGPWANPAQLARMRAGTTHAEAWSLPPNPMLAPLLQAQLDEMLAPLYDTGAPWLAPALSRDEAVPQRIAEQLAVSGQAIRDAWDRVAERIGTFGVSLRMWLPEDEQQAPEQDELGRPPAPRPSSTPPMWENDPTRTRRRRNR